jgi:hypothetical protein
VVLIETPLRGSTMRLLLAVILALTVCAFGQTYTIKTFAGGQTQTRLQGEFRLLIADDFVSHKSILIPQLATSERLIRLEMDNPDTVQPNSRVQVQGHWEGETFKVESFSPPKAPARSTRLVPQRGR